MTGDVIGPDALQGLWRRDWIRAPGFEDASTRVFWAQAGALYADLRIPVHRPLPDGARCLAELDAGALLGLMKAEGFAGTITVADSICTWAREINWHGLPDGIDAGQMWFAEDGALIEDGVHAEYRERWLAGAPPPLTAHRVRSGDLTGGLVLSDDMFLMGLGRLDAEATGAMVEELENGDIPAGLPAHFDTEYAFGHWDGDRGIADLCTNPFREGQCVLERSATGWLRHHAAFDGTARVSPLIL